MRQLARSELENSKAVSQHQFQDLQQLLSRGSSKISQRISTWKHTLQTQYSCDTTQDNNLVHMENQNPHLTAWL